MHQAPHNANPTPDDAQPGPDTASASAPDATPKAVPGPGTVEWVQSQAAELGFAIAGVAPAHASPHAQAFYDWLDAGHHGTMDYLATTKTIRPDPDQLLPGAQAVICVADLYSDVLASETDLDAPDSNKTSATDAQPTGRFARYGWGRDYHKVIKKRLHTLADALAAQFPDHQFRCTTDTAPLFERELAQRAGLGWTGKHTLLIHPQLGSWLLLGCIVTTLPLPTRTRSPRKGTSEGAGPERRPRDLKTSPNLHLAPLIDPDADHCGSCTACIDACPTDAIDPAGRKVLGNRCISYLTLEHRQTIDPSFFEAMDHWLGGCDICQDICPHNRPRHPRNPRKGHRVAGAAVGTSSQKMPPAGSQPPGAPLPGAGAGVHADYLARDHAPGLPLLEVLAWTEADRQKHLAGTAFMRMKLPMLRRNALIALGNASRNTTPNAQADAWRATIESHVNDPDPLVAQTAIDVLANLSQPNG